MARIRSIKPEFFIDEELQDLEAAHPGAHCMLVFAGLWGHCSKTGVFLSFELADTLVLLCDAGFIRRFCVNDVEYGFVTSFEKHQRITGKEADASPVYPCYCSTITGESLGQHRGNIGETPVKPPDAQEREKERERDIDLPLPSKNEGSGCPENPDESPPEQKNEPVPKVPPGEVLRLYAEILPQLPKAVLTEPIRVAILARYRTNGMKTLEDWRRYFHRVRDSGYLCGEVNAWRASLDWLVRPANFSKVVNGAFDDAPVKQGTARRIL
jgi:hypothetical protein